MSTFETASELARRRIYRDSLMRMRDRAAETRETLGMIDAEPKMIRTADLRLMELNSAITQENDAIFSLEQKLGIRR